MVKREGRKSHVSWEEVDLNENNGVFFFSIFPGSMLSILPDRSAIFIYARTVLPVSLNAFIGYTTATLKSTTYFKINDGAHEPYPLKYTTVKQTANYSHSLGDLHHISNAANNRAPLL